MKYMFASSRGETVNDWAQALASNSGHGVCASKASHKANGGLSAAPSLSAQPQADQLRPPAPRDAKMIVRECCARQPTLISGRLTHHSCIAELRSNAPPTESWPRCAVDQTPSSTATQQHDATRTPKTRHPGSNPEARPATEDGRVQVAWKRAIVLERAPRLQTPESTASTESTSVYRSSHRPG